ncbi:MAG TPA: LytTR family DNA-binding domain-containing protein [Acidobacteriaceae bacterium]|jgi:DNA-binding LytR/AlgR family response regulator|nr:LytTR family DNA-binding domain-containing protein [Acidobacteriaceae bacterium]
MTISGWQAAHSNQGQSRSGNLELVLSDDAAQRGATGAGHACGLDSAPASGKASGTAPAKYLVRMTVKAGDKIVLVPVCDILWIQSHGNLLQLHLDTATYEHRMTIKDLCRRLDPERFLRVHRNALVNLDHVVDFDLPRYGNAFVHLRNGKALPISRTVRLVLRRGLLSQSYASTATDDLE